MTYNFYKYYNEIRNRCLIIFSAWLLCLSICYLYKENILFILINFNSSFIKLNKEPYFIFTDITEIFNVYIELTLFVANQMAIFLLLYHSFMFISLGLYKFELIRINSILKIVIITWLISLTLLYHLIIPISWNFFLSFYTNSNTLQPIAFFFETRLIEYFNHFQNVYYLCLISCQFLGFLILALTSFTEKFKQTKAFRKLFYLIFIIFSTIITPPDVISQISIGISLILFYETLIVIKFIQISMVAN